MIAIVEPVEPVIVHPVFMPIIECGNQCGNLPGWDWLWLTLGTLGGIGVAVVLFALLAIWLES